MPFDVPSAPLRTRQHSVLDPRRYIAPNVKQAMHAVIDEMSVARRHRQGAKALRQLCGNGDLRLNLGCGPNCKDGWVNVDLSGASGAIPLDLRQPIPVPDSTASMIYTEHFFEHLEYSNAKMFLTDCLRILIPGGRLSVGVPDIEPMLHAYVRKDNAFFQLYHQWHPDWCDTYLHQINYAFRQGSEHKYAYDCETMTRMVVDAGFVAVARREFDAALDSPDRAIGTLYVDGRKPE